jgi:ribosomal protein S18 acetylase RimI-like enzyme
MLHQTSSPRSGLALRPFTESDQDFLAALYASTRAEELAVTGWPEDFKASFCAQQFAAQTVHYQAHYREASFCVIEREGTPIGRLIVWRSPASLHVIDISLLPAARGQGIGSRLLADLLAEASEAGKQVSLCVDKMNRAGRLYERLGFEITADEGVSWRMVWGAPASLKTPQEPQMARHQSSTTLFDRPDGPRVPSAAAA